MHGYQFQKTDRLLKRRAFLHILQNGKQRRDHYFIVRFGLNDLEKPRLGVTVTKKVGNAVIRNRLKRVAREFFRLNRQTLKSHFDIVIIAKKQAAELSSKQVFSSLMHLFDQLPKNAND